MTNSYGKGVRIAALGLAAATVLSLAAPAHAAKARRAKAPAPAAQSGMMVAIDPATGKIRQPTAAESKALVAGIQEMTKASSRPAGAEAVRGRHDVGRPLQFVPEHLHGAGTAGWLRPRGLRRQCRRCQCRSNRRPGLRGQVKHHEDHQTPRPLRHRRPSAHRPRLRRRPDRHRQHQRSRRGLQRSHSRRSRRRQHRHHHRPAAAERLPVRRRHLGLDPEQPGSDLHPVVLHPARLHRDRGHPGLGRRDPGLRQLPEHRAPEHLVSRRPGQQAGRRRPRSGRQRHQRGRHHRPLQQRSRQAQLPGRDRLVPRPGRQPRHQHRPGDRAAPRVRPRPGLLRLL